MSKQKEAVEKDTSAPITRELRLAVADALIAVWERNGTVDDVVARVRHALGRAVAFTEVREVLGVTWLPCIKLRSFVHTHARYLSDAMWDSRSNAHQINQARRACGMRAVVGTASKLAISAKNRDKRFDWSTVK